MTISKQRLIQFLKFCFWGGITTLINVAVYTGCRWIDISVSVSTGIAWFISVAAAFISNRRYVFNADSQNIRIFIKQCCCFYASRIFSGVIDIIFMAVTVSILNFNELFCKIADEIFVSLLNYLLSIIFVFKEHRE